MEKKLEKLVELFNNGNRNEMPNEREWKEIHHAFSEFSSVFDASRFEGFLNVQLPGHRLYDSFIDNMFDSIFKGISREALVEELLSSLSPNSNLDSDSIWKWVHIKSSAIFSVCVDVTLTSEGWEPYNSSKVNGIHASRSDNYVASVSKITESKLFDYVVKMGEPLKLRWTSKLDSYSNEFEVLVDKKYRIDKLGMWVTGVPLISNDRGVPQRGVFFAYPNIGDEVNPQYPRGVLQEIRVLQFFSLAYRFLRHRLSELTKQVQNRRQDLIISLSPGILHHELGQGIDLLRTRLSVITETVSDLWSNYEDSEIENILNELLKLDRQFLKVYSITNAFNNLERRHPTEEFDLKDVIEQTTTVCHFRLAKASISLEMGKPNRVLMYSDAGLLQLVLTNIITNACNACEANIEKEYTLRIDVINSSEMHNKADNTVLMRMSNNGPPIPLQDREKIMDAGFTRRPGNLPRGHGQGLQVCKMICNFLGGDIALIDIDDLDEGMNVGFEIELPIKLSDQQEL